MKRFILAAFLTLAGCSSNPDEYAKERESVVNTADAVGAALDKVCPRCSKLLGRGGE